MIKISVIISTCNRYDLLKTCFMSMLKQTLPQPDYEIIVINNGTKDKAKFLINKYKRRYKNIKYFREKNFGLHNTRHRGAMEAKGKILAYCDDDVVADKNWLKEIYKSFRNKNVDLLSGKILPLYEKKLPWWLNYFWTKISVGKYLGYLSLLDLGNKEKIIPPEFVFGCNYSIRKSKLYECNGFHPDSFPKSLLKYRGDGETALSKEVLRKKGIIFYNPKVIVKHFVSKGRMTIDYFCKRAFRQGVSDSYTQIRKEHGFDNDKNSSFHKGRKRKSIIKQLSSRLSRFIIYNFGRKESREIGRVKRKIKKSCEAGFSFHQREVKKDPKLLEWVLRKNYLGKNGRIPISKK